MKYLLGCLASAILGGIVAVSLVDSRLPQDQLIAQERFRDRRPGFPAPGSAPLSFPEEDRFREPGQRPLDRGTADVTTARFAGDELSPDEQINVSVYESVNKSVVNITTKSVRSDGLFFLEVASEGAGSGSVLDRNGMILTNYHVVEGAKQVNVTLYNGKSYDASLVGADPINDVAVIHIDAPPEVLFPVTFGDSSELKVGMRVFAIGNPFGLERTLTTGIISSLNRTLQIHGNRSIKSIIQTDAAINPGSSGGPLMDTRGRLIGMNTAIASSTGQSAGIGFAIPVNLIARIVPQLIENGRVIRPEIGISKVYQTEQGLLIAHLTPGGPAEQAGLRGPQVTRKRRGPFVVEQVDRSVADLIVAVDGNDVKTADDFLNHIEARNPGDHVTLTIVRDGRRLQVRVRLARGDEPPAPAR